MTIFLFFKMAAAAIFNFRNLKFLTVGAVKSVELRHHAKFRYNRPKRGRYIAIYRFFKMAAAAILDFRNLKFLKVGRSKGLNYVTTPNFVEISRNAAEILRFIGFQDGGRRRLGFLKFQIFNGRNGQEGRSASPCQIW